MRRCSCSCLPDTPLEADAFGLTMHSRGKVLAVQGASAQPLDGRVSLQEFVTIVRTHPRICARLKARGLFPAELRLAPSAWHAGGRSQGKKPKMTVIRFCPSCEKWLPFGFHPSVAACEAAYNRDAMAASNKPMSRNARWSESRPERYREIIRAYTRGRRGKAL